MFMSICPKDIDTNSPCRHSPLCGAPRRLGTFWRFQSQPWTGMYFPLRDKRRRDRENFSWETEEMKREALQSDTEPEKVPAALFLYGILSLSLALSLTPALSQCVPTRGGEPARDSRRRH